MCIHVLPPYQKLAQYAILKNKRRARGPLRAWRLSYVAQNNAHNRRKGKLVAESEITLTVIISTSTDTMINTKMQS